MDRYAYIFYTDVCLCGHPAWNVWGNLSTCPFFTFVNIYNELPLLPSGQMRTVRFLRIFFLIHFTDEQVKKYGREAFPAC